MELGARYLRLLLKYQPHSLFCDRASGNALCSICGLILYDHMYFNVTEPEDMVFHALAIDCEGRVLKL